MRQALCYPAQMRRIKKDIRTAWKQKIDPAFDKLIKTHVDFLTSFASSPREGLLNFPNDFIDPILKEFSSDASEADSESLDVMFSFLEKAGLPLKRVIRTFHSFYSAKNADEMLKYCPEMIESLPEPESRKFYEDKLEFYNKHPEQKPDSEILNKKNLDFYSVFLSLSIRYVFAKLSDDGNEINASDNLLKKSGALVPILGMILSSFSQLVHQKTLEELKENIVKGDDKSLFKAVTIDKNILYLDVVKKRIGQAQLSGDSDFFGNLGRAIASNPLKRIGQHGKTYTVLKIYWLMGLYKLTNEELYYFLKLCGLIPPEYPHAFQKFVKRHIRSVYNF